MNYNQKGKNNPNYKYGYKTLIIWEHELKNMIKVKEKILRFNEKQV